MSNFQPKPREEQPDEHKLRPEHENIIVDRAKLNDHKIQGSACSDMAVPIGGISVPIPIAAIIIETQTNIPKEKMPPLRKIPTTYKSYQHQFMWSAVDKIAWEQDETYRYIPCYSRYVVNNDGLVKNAFTGKEVGNINVGGLKLIQDGRSQKPWYVDKNLINLLVRAKIPKNFLDYGFSGYSYSLGATYNAELEGIVVKWDANKPISARSNVDGSIIKCPNVQEFLAANVKDYDATKAAIANIGKLSREKAVFMDTYSVLLGDDHDDPIKFGPKSEPGTEAQVDSSSSYNWD